MRLRGRRFSLGKKQRAHRIVAELSPHLHQRRVLFDAAGMTRLARLLLGRKVALRLRADELRRTDEARRNAWSDFTTTGFAEPTSRSATPRAYGYGTTMFYDGEDLAERFEQLGMLSMAILLRERIQKAAVALELQQVLESSSS